MKKLFAFIVVIAPIAIFASNYPADYCNAVVRVCENGPGIVAHITSGCNSGAYVVGYKKSGRLGNSSFVDAILQYNFGNNVNQKVLRITPDWHNLGFITSEINAYSFIGGRGYGGSLDSISIAFSDAKGNWDSKNGDNYNYPIGVYDASTCYSVKTNEMFTSQVPYAAWNVINEAMSR